MNTTCNLFFTFLFFILSCRYMIFIFFQGSHDAGIQGTDTEIVPSVFLKIQDYLDWIQEGYSSLKPGLTI